MSAPWQAAESADQQAASAHTLTDCGVPTACPLRAWTGCPALLTDDEVARLISVAVWRPEISLTSNGIGLDHEAAVLLRFCLERGYQLRFIEQMPLDAQHGWRRTDMVTADGILAALSAQFTL